MNLTRIRGGIFPNVSPLWLPQPKPSQLSKTGKGKGKTNVKKTFVNGDLFILAKLNICIFNIIYAA